jgi:hypothetical protein
MIHQVHVLKQQENKLAHINELKKVYEYARLWRSRSFKLDFNHDDEIESIIASENDKIAARISDGIKKKLKL